MKQKTIRLSSLFLAMLMLLTAILPSGTMTVHAASSLKAALKEESGKGIPADEGWSLFKALSKVPASNRSYINLGGYPGSQYHGEDRKPDGRRGTDPG